MQIVMLKRNIITGFYASPWNQKLPLLFSIFDGYFDKIIITIHSLSWESLVQNLYKDQFKVIWEFLWSCCALQPWKPPPPTQKKRKKREQEEVIKMFMIGGFVSFAYRNIVEGDIFPLITCHAELENRLLARFDAASQKRELSTMAECAKFLSQVILLSCDWTGYFYA